MSRGVGQANIHQTVGFVRWKEGRSCRDGRVVSDGDVPYAFCRDPDGMARTPLERRRSGKEA